MKLSTSTILHFPYATEKISLLISIDTDQSSIDNQVTIVVTGPINRNYFAIGFGNIQMLQTYSIIFYPNSEPNEYLLTSKTSQQQKLLNTSINIDYFSNSQNMIKSVITRDIEGITDDHYSFNNVITNSLNKLDIIYAMSSSQNISRSNTLNYHGIYKNKTTIYFQQESNETNPSSFDFIDNFLDDADNINNFENYINHTQFVTIGDILPPSINNADSDTNFFNFLTKSQWIVLSGGVACFLIMSLILLLFYRFYRRWKIRSLYDTADEDEDDDEISHHGGLKQKSSIIHHCYHEKKKSILTQLDDEMLDEIHGAVMPQCIDIDEDDDNYYYNDNMNQRAYHNRGKVGDFMRNVMPFEIPKDLIALNDEDESYEDDDEEAEFEEDEEELGHDNEVEEEEEQDQIISDLSDSGSVRM